MRSDGCTDAINRAEQGVASVRGRICLTIAGLFIYTVSGILLTSLPMTACMRFWGDFGLSHGFALPLTLALRMVHYRERTQGQDCAGITR